MQRRNIARACASLLVPFLLSGLAGSALAQYKYIGPDGRVVYSDQPPPPSAKGVQKAGPSGAAAPASNTPGLPYALQQAVKTFPVTLYTSKDCEACNQGRTFLVKRGIPFTEKTVGNADDFKMFKDATGSNQVPVMVVGSGKQIGFEEGAWNGALNAAGYPPNSLLPAGYRNPAPVPTAPFTPEAKPTPNAGGAPQTAQGGAANGGAPTPGAPNAPAGPAPASGDKPPTWFKGF